MLTGKTYSLKSGMLGLCFQLQYCVLLNFMSWKAREANHYKKLKEVLSLSSLVLNLEYLRVYCLQDELLVKYY